MNAVDQVVLDRIGRGVNQLVEHIVAADQPHHADLLGRPEVLPAAPECILAPREELVKMLYELGILSERVEDHCMVVIRHGARKQYRDRAPLGGFDEAVGERVVGLGIGPEQELALRAAARDQVEVPGKDLPWQGHTRRYVKDW